MQPGFTHAMLFDFENQDSLSAFIHSNSLQTAIAPLLPVNTDPETSVFAYVF
jgi:hypothetical protein